jgi:hypothetical protein
VLIGKRWHGERAGQPPRLDDADDPVRGEIAGALAGGMQVIPLLLDGASMPTAAQLPADLQALARRNALELGNTRFNADIERLVAALRDALGEAAPAPVRRRALLGGGLALAALLTAGALWLQRAPPVPAPPVRAAVNGSWQAEVEYDWPGAHYTERFQFGGEGTDLYGSASFLRSPRGVLEGSVGPDGLRFVTHSGQEMNGRSFDTVHRYRGKLVGDEIRFVMQTEAAATPHVPVEFVARRVAAPASQAAR